MLPFSPGVIASARRFVGEGYLDAVSGAKTFVSDLLSGAFPWTPDNIHIDNNFEITKVKREAYGPATFGGSTWDTLYTATYAADEILLNGTPLFTLAGITDFDIDFDNAGYPVVSYTGGSGLSNYTHQDTAHTLIDGAATNAFIVNELPEDVNAGLIVGYEKLESDSSNIVLGIETSPYLLGFDAATLLTYPIANTLSGIVYDVDLSADGLWLAVGSRNPTRATVYSTTDYLTPIVLPDQPADWARRLRFSHDSTMLAIANTGSSCVVYNTSDWTTKLTITHPNSIYGYTVEFNQDDSEVYLATTGGGAWLRRFSTDTGNYLGDIVSYGAEFIYDAKHNGDFSLLAISGTDSPEVKVLDAVTFAQITSVDLPFAANCVDWSGDGTMLAVGVAGGDYLYIFNTDTWVPISVLQTPTSSVLDVEFVGEELYVGVSAAPNLLIYSVVDYSILKAPPTGVNSSVWGVTSKTTPTSGGTNAAYRLSHESYATERIAADLTGGGELVKMGMVDDGGDKRLAMKFTPPAQEV